MKLNYNIKTFLSGAALAVLVELLLFSKSCHPVEGNSSLIPDTVYVNVPYRVVKIQRVEVPKKVYIYQRDTVLREKMVQGTLISGIQLSPKLAKIHTLDRFAQPEIKEYALSDYKELSINYEGQLEVKRYKHPKRRKLLKRLGRIGIFAGGFFVGKTIYKQ